MTEKQHLIGLPHLGRFLSEKLSAKSFTYNQMEIHSFSSEISSLNGESSSKYNESFSKEELTVSQTHQEEKTFFKKSLLLLQKYLNMQESPFKTLSENIQSLNCRGGGAGELGTRSKQSKSKDSDIDEPFGSLLMYPECLREVITRRGKERVSFSELEKAVEAVPPPKNHKKKLTKIKIIADSQQNSVRKWVHHRCLSSKNPAKIKYFYRLEKIKSEKLLELEQYIQSLRQGLPARSASPLGAQQKNPRTIKREKKQYSEKRESLDCQHLNFFNNQYIYPIVDHQRPLILSMVTRAQSENDDNNAVKLSDLALANSIEYQTFDSCLIKRFNKKYLLVENEKIQKILDNVLFS